ncbi:protein of unknown function UPF0153 [Delftia acidovorans SPH-1]|uniref:YkgJ family cysteine cluster protein n=2 Tax=Comamonadaceae TaxID=80864 RepID=A9BP97_DELAS|nr:protein of unknown function UPF0153 [Delftia acidovorans SPH-1]
MDAGAASPKDPPPRLATPARQPPPGFLTKNSGPAHAHPPTMRSPISIVDVDRLDSWSKYKPGMCDSCAANCCTMPLEVQLPDLVRLELVDPFEVDNVEPKLIAKRLMKMRLIDHYNPKHNIFTMARRASGDCNFLDAQSRRCTVYDKRPETCRLHPKKGPKPGFCAYGHKDR